MRHTLATYQSLLESDGYETVNKTEEKLVASKDTDIVSVTSYGGSVHINRETKIATGIIRNFSVRALHCRAHPQSLLACIGIHPQ